MTKLFISYRREDTKVVAGRIYDTLTIQYKLKGVFKDDQKRELSVDFEERILRNIKTSKILLVLIGNYWIFPENDQRNRFFEKVDYVRTEIIAASAQGAIILPVLIDGAKMPAEELLPESIRFLTKSEAMTIRSGSDYARDMKDLYEFIRANQNFFYKWRKALISSGSIVAIAAYLWFFNPNLLAQFWPKKEIPSKHMLQHLGDTPQTVVPTPIKEKKDDIFEKEAFPEGVNGIKNYLASKAGPNSKITYVGFEQPSSWVDDYNYVKISFAIDAKGRPENVKSLGEKKGSFSKEIVQLISTMPAWNPCRKNGTPVRSKTISLFVESLRPCNVKPESIENKKLQFMPREHTNGDKDFNGNGPKIDVQVELVISTDRKRIYGTISMIAREWANGAAKSDFTTVKGSVYVAPENLIYEAQSGFEITDISSPKKSETSFVAKGKGLGLQAKDAGLVNRYEFYGDQDGPDAGVYTKVLIRFNTIKISLVDKTNNCLDVSKVIVAHH